MKTPREKYLNDPQYRHLVDMIENQLEQGNFTPSEMREACIIASTNHVSRRVRPFLIPREVGEAFQIIEEYADKNQENT